MTPTDAENEVRAIVSDFFQGDEIKQQLWWLTKNPLLGDITPQDMVVLGKHERLLKIVKGWREGNMP